MENPKEWFAASELLSLNGLPRTEQGLNKKARSNNWIKRKKAGVQGRALEYHYSSLPMEVQESLGFEAIPPQNEQSKISYAAPVHPNSKVAEESHYNYSTELSRTLSPSKDLVVIPQFDLAASAGNGSYVVAENPIANFTFSQDWIINHGLHNKKLTIVPVKGDSMEEKLFDGDLIIVSIIEDMREAREGICVVRYDDEIFVKRVHYDWQNKGYDIISDNKIYKPRHIPEQDIIDGRFAVVGKMEFRLQRTKNY